MIMQRFVAACVALLLLMALILWWQEDEAIVDSSQTTAPEVRVGANVTADRLPLTHGEVAASETLTLPTTGVVGESTTLTVIASRADSNTNQQSNCVRKDDEMPKEAVEINAALRNSESSALDKEACFAAVDEIKSARWMFDATPTQTVAYRPLAHPNWHGLSVQETVLHELCSGDQSFDASAKATVQLFFVTANETTKILIGPNWVSEGTIRSPLTEEQYSHITKLLSGRRRDVVGPGGNMSAEIFDRRLKERYFNRIAADEEMHLRRERELRQAQRGLPSDCIE
jgi:hypothetical protein